MWHVQLPRARPRDGGAQGDLLGQQQGKEEDRDADGEEEVKVPQDLPLVLCSQEIAGGRGRLLLKKLLMITTKAVCGYNIISPFIKQIYCTLAEVLCRDLRPKDGR